MVTPENPSTAAPRHDIAPCETACGWGQPRRRIAGNAHCRLGLPSAAPVTPRFLAAVYAQRDAALFHLSAHGDRHNRNFGHSKQYSYGQPTMNSRRSLESTE